MPLSYVCLYMRVCVYIWYPPPPLTKVFFNNLCSGTPPLDASWVRVMSWLGPITFNAALIKPPNSLRNSWKTLTRPMFSMNFWFFLWLIPGDSLKNHKFMENIGLANVFHCFFHGNSWKTLAWPMLSMNLWFFRESPGISQESRKNQKFMENIGLANVFHEFQKTMENIGLGQCFP